MTAVVENLIIIKFVYTHISSEIEVDVFFLLVHLNELHAGPPGAVLVRVFLLEQISGERREQA